MPSLEPGERLGPYEIVSPLGAGGMGEVYRARDSRLDREVAVKILPREMAADPERLRRFEVEARAVGQLNHPGLLTLHDLGEHDGQPYLVTELLEGRSLREVLEHGALAPRKALELAAQVARGLAAAHEKGVVHRDLKPDNLFVTREGRAKILDFGLAKLRSKASAASNLATGDTVVEHTDPGTLLGTVGYMSPEQVQGEPADARSDLFSLGAVLYEMLAGKRAFARRSAVETMTAILREEPAELETGGGRPVPPGLERILRRLLEKDPQQRFQSAADLAYDLESLSVLSDETRIGSAAPLVARRRAGFVFPLLALLAGAGVTWWLASLARQPATAPSFQRITFRRGNVLHGRFAPDGQTVVYAAAWDGAPAELFLARTEEAGESRPIGLARANLLAVSSRSELAVLLKDDYLGSTTGQGLLARLPLVGGAPREVLEGVIAADWSPDGAELAVLRVVEGRSRLEYPMGRSIAEWGALGPVTIRVSPDGDRIAFWEAEADGLHAALSTIGRDGGKLPVSSGWQRIDSFTWAPSGRELLVTGRRGGDTALWAIAPGGEPRVLLRSPDRLAVHDVARDGRLLVERETSRLGLLARPPGVGEERELAWMDVSVVAGISADGTQLLFGENGEGGGAHGAAFLRGTDGGPPVRLGEGRATRLSPDGRTALVIGGSPPELILLPTGAGEPRKVELGALTPFIVSWFMPDGERLIAVASAPTGEVGVYLVTPGGGAPAKIAGEEVIDGVAISPDGASVAFQTQDGSVAIYPTGGGEIRPGAGFEPGDVPIHWSADGRTVYARRKGELPERVFAVDVASGRRTLWRTLMPSDSTGVIGIDAVAIAPETGAYAYSYSRITTSDLYLVSGLDLR